MEIKTIKVEEFFETLRGAKVTGLDGQSKFCVVKILRKLRPVIDDIRAFRADAVDKFKPENWDETLKKFQGLSRGEITLSQDESEETIKDVFTFDSKIKNLVVEEFGEIIHIDVQAISEESFEGILAFNDWDSNVALLMADTLLPENSESESSESEK